jgi:hypothetical protein
MAAQKSTELRRRLHEVEADRTALRRQDEFEHYALAAPAGHPILHGYLIARTIIVNLPSFDLPGSAASEIVMGRIVAILA